MAKKPGYVKKHFRSELCAHDRMGKFIAGGQTVCMRCDEDEKVFNELEDAKAKLHKQDAEIAKLREKSKLFARVSKELVELQQAYDMLLKDGDIKKSFGLLCAGALDATAFGVSRQVTREIHEEKVAELVAEIERLKAKVVELEDEVAYHSFANDEYGVTEAIVDVMQKAAIAAKNGDPCPCGCGASKIEHCWWATHEGDCTDPKCPGGCHDETPPL